MYKNGIDVPLQFNQSPQSKGQYKHIPQNLKKGRISYSPKEPLFVPIYPEHRCRRCSNYIFHSEVTPGFNGLGKDNC